MIDDLLDDHDYNAGLLIADALDAEIAAERRERRRYLLLLVASLAVLGCVYAVLR